MAGRIIQAAKRTGAGVPLLLSRRYKTGETFIKGAALVLDANGELTECAATPTSLIGFAAEPAGSKPGYNAANSPTVVTGRVQEADCFEGAPEQIFSGSFRSAASTYVVPTQTIINESYGLAKDADGTWYVNQADTTNLAVTIVDISTGDGTPDVVFFVVKSAARQIP